MKLSKLSFFLFVLLIVSGCAAPPGKGERFLYSEHENGVGNAIIYHYRESELRGVGVAYDVTCNDELMTRIGSYGFYKQMVTPGTYTYQTRTVRPSALILALNAYYNAKSEFTNCYTITTEPGHEYFLNWSPSSGNSCPVIKLINKSEALKAMEGLHSFEEYDALRAASQQ